MNNITELNALKQRPQNTLVKIVPETDARVTAANPGALKAMKVPSFTDHPLVRGPAYRDIAVSVVSMGLDTKSCGVMGKRTLA